MGKAKFSSLISIQQTYIEVLLGARLGAGCWAYGTKGYLSFVPQELTNQETDHKDMCSITVVHDKGTQPPSHSTPPFLQPHFLDHALASGPLYSPFPVPQTLPTPPSLPSLHPVPG